MSLRPAAPLSHALAPVHFLSLSPLLQLTPGHIKQLRHLAFSSIEAFFLLKIHSILDHFFGGPEIAFGLHKVKFQYRQCKKKKNRLEAHSRRLMCKRTSLTLSEPL